MPVDVAEAIKDLIDRILNNREDALQYARDPEGTLVAQGVTDGDYSNLDMFQVVTDAYADNPAFQGYGSGSNAGGSSSAGASSASSGGVQPPPPAATGQSVDQIMQHLNYVTYAAYEGDEYVQQEITNIDQSQNLDVDVDGDLRGDITVDSHDVNANATGDGSAASNFGPAVAGDENLVNTGTNLGQQNTGDDAAQGVASGDGNVVQNTGEFTGIQAGDDVDVSDAALSFGAGDASADETVVTTTVSDDDTTTVSDDDTTTVSDDDTTTVSDDDTTTVSDDDTTTVTDIDTNTQTAGDDLIGQIETDEGDATQQVAEASESFAPQQVLDASEPAVDAGNLE